MMSLGNAEIYKNTEPSVVWIKIEESLNNAGHLDIPMTPDICKTTVDEIKNRGSTTGGSANIGAGNSSQSFPTAARRTWSSKETKALIGFYGDRKSEFDVSRKKKQAFVNVLHDLESSGVLEGPITIYHIDNKMKGLIKAYKCSVDSEGLTGQGVTISPFYAEMNKIFGNTVLSPAQHTIAVDTTEMVIDERPVNLASPPIPDDYEMDQEVLIIAVQKRPCIYNKGDLNYHNREYLRKSWDEISFEVNETIESCQKRWRYLRDYYIKQRRVYMKSDGTRKKIWPFFDMLSFLNPFLQTYAEYTDNEIKDDDYNNSSTNPMEEELTNEDFMEEYQQTTSTSPAPKRTKLTGKLNQRMEIGPSDDHEYFFKSLLPMARSMDQSKILQFRIEVQQVLMKYVNSSNSNYSSALNGFEDVLVVKREPQE